MKTKEISSVNLRKGNLKKNFKAFYSPQQIKNMRNFILENKHLNPKIDGVEIMRMMDSMDSFNAFYKGLKSISAQGVANELYRKMGIPADFNGDKILAGCCGLVANIFHHLHLPQPKGIYKTALEPNVLGCCNGMTRILKFTSDFDWNKIQNEAIEAKVCNFSSSGHFLKTILHEFFHNVQVKQLHDIAKRRTSSPLINTKVFEILGFNPDFKTKLILDNMAKISNEKVKRLLEEKVSSYGATLPAEAYTETVTKMVTDVLNKKTLRPICNPFVYKEFTQDKALMEILTDFYTGNFQKYI